MADPMQSILTLAAAATTFAKLLVDIVRMTGAKPTWLSPVLALMFGVASVLLLMVAGGEVLTAQSVAQAVLAGVLAAGGAVGVTELSRRAM
jgi:hypothetical protein